MSIIVALAGMAMLITPRFAEDQRTTRGADMIQGWLLGAKQRAYRDQTPRGLRLVRSSDNPLVVRELVWIERPEDLKGEPDPGVVDTILTQPSNFANTNRNHLQVPPVTMANVPNAHSFVFVPNWDLVSNDSVLPGDWLKINTYETQPYNIHRIANVLPFTSRSRRGIPVQGTLLQLMAADNVTPSLVRATIAMEDDTRYQIIRGTRPMSGEPMLQLPSGVAVDLDAGTVGTSVLSGAADGLDLLFDARGQLTGGNGTAGKVVLRVRNADRPATFGEQLFVLVFSRTGLISACPVGDAGDPYAFTRDGKQNGF